MMDKIKIIINLENTNDAEQYEMVITKDGVQKVIKG